MTNRLFLIGKSEGKHRLIKSFMPESNIRAVVKENQGEMPRLLSYQGRPSVVRDTEQSMAIPPTAAIVAERNGY